MQLCVSGELVNTEWVGVKAGIQKAETGKHYMVYRDFRSFLFLNKVFRTFLMFVFETLTPQCFAKAGKMEPNHLLNGFGPLQPAVAML